VNLANFTTFTSPIAKDLTSVIFMVSFHTCDTGVLKVMEEVHHAGDCPRRPNPFGGWERSAGSRSLSIECLVPYSLSVHEQALQSNRQ